MISHHHWTFFSNMWPTLGHILVFKMNIWQTLGHILVLKWPVTTTEHFKTININNARMWELEGVYELRMFAFTTRFFFCVAFLLGVIGSSVTWVVPRRGVTQHSGLSHRQLQQNLPQADDHKKLEVGSPTLSKSPELADSTAVLIRWCGGLIRAVRSFVCPCWRLHDGNKHFVFIKATVGEHKTRGHRSWSLFHKRFIFQACTGNDHIEECIAILEQYNWDLTVRYCCVFCRHATYFWTVPSAWKLVPVWLLDSSLDQPEQQKIVLWWLLIFTTGFVSRSEKLCVCRKQYKMRWKEWCLLPEKQSQCKTHNLTTRLFCPLQAQVRFSDNDFFSRRLTGSFKCAQCNH